MFRCIDFSEVAAEEWDKVATSHGSIFHTSAFRRLLLETFEYECAYRAIVDEQQQIRALLPMIISRNLGLRRAAVALPFINYLDICATDDIARNYVLTCIPDLRERLGVDYIELRLKEQDYEGEGWQRQLQHYTFVLPLQGEEEKILALSSSSNRNHVRKAYKNNWFTASFEVSQLEKFYCVYVQRMKQLGSPAPSIRFFQRFFEQFPEQAYLLTVLDAQTGAVAGGMLLLASPSNGTLYYPYGANLVEYNSKYLNNFMYWEAIKLGRKLGLPCLDLGRSQLDSGTYRYKEQWGAEAVPLQYLTYAGRREMPIAAGLDKGRLGLCIEMWKRLPQFVTEPVGKHLIKYLLP